MANNYTTYYMQVRTRHSINPVQPPIHPFPLPPHTQNHHHQSTSSQYQPEVWNRDIVKTGRRKLMIQGATTMEEVDHIPLKAEGALWYDPTKNGDAGKRAWAGGAGGEERGVW